jgi:RNA polymerase sigma factor (sigma-70 family)
MEPTTLRPWTEPGNDTALLTAARQGDVDALLRLFATHRRGLWRACVAITRDAVEAERLFHETVLQTTLHLRLTPEGEPFLPWLVSVARRLEAERREERGALPAIGARRPNGEPWYAGSHGAHYVEDEQRTLQAFANLHEDDQWLLALRLFDRLPYPEIERVTGMPVAQVAQRIAAAREYLDRARVAGSMEGRVA